MEFQAISVGAKVCTPDNSDSIIFDMTDSGGLLIHRMYKPTSKEVRAFKSPATQMKFVTIEGIIFLLVRHGTSPWGDAPFHKQLTRATSILRSSEVPPNMGLAIHIMLIDSSTGILVAQRLFSMSHEETVSFLDAVAEQKPMPNIDEVLQHIYQKYSTSDMVALANTQNLHIYNH